MEKPQVLMEVSYVRRRCPFLLFPLRFSLLHCPFSSLGEWAAEEAAAPQQGDGGPRKARVRACRHQQAARSPRARLAWARSRVSPPPRPRPGPAAPRGRAAREALRGDSGQEPGQGRAGGAGGAWARRGRGGRHRPGTGLSHSGSCVSLSPEAGRLAPPRGSWRQAGRTILGRGVGRRVPDLEVPVINSPKPLAICLHVQSPNDQETLEALARLPELPAAELTGHRGGGCGPGKRVRGNETESRRRGWKLAAVG